VSEEDLYQESSLGAEHGVIVARIVLGERSRIAPGSHDGINNALLVGRGVKHLVQSRLREINVSRKHYAYSHKIIYFRYYTPIRQLFSITFFFTPAQTPLTVGLAVEEWLIFFCSFWLKGTISWILESRKS
jgi:hypothetical protein